MTRSSHLLHLALATLVLWLLLVGVVSGTPMRHLVQAAPVIGALLLVWRRVPWSRYAALPLMLFWLIIVVLIWLFLLGVARIITGTFSPAERLLTLAMGGSCILGGVAALRTPASGSWTTRALAFVAFAVLQIIALWVSLQPQIAQR